jgi:hypothetical protein
MAILLAASPIAGTGGHFGTSGAWTQQSDGRSTRHYVPGMTERRRSLFVTPFYLQMMRFNSVQQSSDVLTGIKEVGQEASAADVVALLRDHWRERVMGAWFALLFDDEQVTESVLQALSSSFGNLDSPPLAIAATVLAGPRALPSLQAYALSDSEHRWGACGFMAIAIQHLGGSSPPCDCGDSDRDNFATMLELAEQLRSN